MNKQEFLKELQGRIRILAEAEQQDILAEYAQHIDLRTASGLTEEEAIRDFGDLGQLAAEILEAYRVDPAQLGGGPVQKQRPLLPALSQSLRRSGAAAGGFFRRAGSGAASFFRRAGRGIATALGRCGRTLKGLFRRRPKPEPPAPEPMKEDTPMNPNLTTAARPARRGAGQAAKGAFRALGRFLRAVVRLMWNLVLLLLAAPFGLAGMAALICIGFLAVLLLQGYPLAGVLLCCLGGALCCAAVVGLLLTLLWRRPAAAVISAAAADPGAPASPPEAGTGEEATAEPGVPASALIARTVEEELAAPPQPEEALAAPPQPEEGEDDHA